MDYRPLFDRYPTIDYRSGEFLEVAVSVTVNRKSLEKFGDVSKAEGGVRSVWPHDEVMALELIDRYHDRISYVERLLADDRYPYYTEGYSTERFDNLGIAHYPSRGDDTIINIGEDDAALAKVSDINVIANGAFGLSAPMNAIYVKVAKLDDMIRRVREAVDE